MLTKLDKFINNYYVYFIVASIIITVVGFALAILAEEKNDDAKEKETDGVPDIYQLDQILKLKLDASTYAYTGLIMLFAGFIISSSLQTYILFHTHKKIIKQ